MRLIDRLQTVLLCVYPNIRLVEIPKGEFNFLFENEQYECLEFDIGSTRNKFSDVLCVLFQNIERVQDEVLNQLELKTLPDDFVTVVTHRGDLVLEEERLFGTFSVTSIKSITPTISTS